MSTTIEHRSRKATVEVRDAAAGKGPGVLHGHAAVFYDANDPGTSFRLWDDVEERVLPTAFDRALAEKDDVRGLVDHDPSRIIGRTSAGTMRLAKDAKGLAYEIDAPDTQVGRDIVTSVKRGDVSGSSFGFSVEDDEVIRMTRDGQPFYVRNLISVRLYDASVVSFPAYESSEASARAARPQELRSALIARAKGEDASPSDPAALKAKADQQAAAEAIQVEADARQRRLRLAELE